MIFDNILQKNKKDIINDINKNIGCKTINRDQFNEIIYSIKNNIKEKKYSLDHFNYITNI